MSLQMTERTKPQQERIILAKQLLDLGLRDADINVAENASFDLDKLINKLFINFILVI